MMPNEYDDSMDEQQNYRHQNRCHGGKLFDRKESRDEIFDLKNYNEHGNVKLPMHSSHDCQLKNSRKHGRENLRMTMSSDQRLDPEISQISRTRKSRSPLTNCRVQNCKSQKIPYESVTHNFDTHEESIYPDHERFMEKSSHKKKHKEKIIQDCMETIHEDDELMKIRKKRFKNEKGKIKAEKCLRELDELKDELAQFEYEKIIPEKNSNDKKERHQLNSKACLRILRSKQSDIDNDDEEEESKLLEEELAKISFCEPCSHAKHSIKTPETNNSTTETSIVEEIDGRAQRNIRRVIDDAIIRESAHNADKNRKLTHDAEESSEATYSDPDDNYNETLRGSQDNDTGSIGFINELKNLKWRYLNHIQDELYRLYDLEQFLDTLTAKNSKSVERNDNRNERPARRGGRLQ